MYVLYSLCLLNYDYINETGLSEGIGSFHNVTHGQNSSALEENKAQQGKMWNDFYKSKNEITSLKTIKTFKYISCWYKKYFLNIQKKILNTKIHYIIKINGLYDNRFVYNYDSLIFSSIVKRNMYNTHWKYRNEINL